ncbi:hypothetical protein WJX75_001928 [Coccomyxa subellipsoidea]|uniref:Uncharacterized protein n=1 Tax=Coccomyxa subellipsoidea TaxID=248742 RepID=A0ABR2YCS4_9CHLO
MERQYEAFAANAGPVANDVINSALNSLGTIIESVTQCGLNISLQAKLVTSNGKQCALCLCAPTANAFTPYLAWKVNGGCAVEPTTTPPLVGYG